MARPMAAVANEVGVEVQKPLADVTIDRLLTTNLFNRLVLPTFAATAARHPAARNLETGPVESGGPP